MYYCEGIKDVYTPEVNSKYRLLTPCVRAQALGFLVCTDLVSRLPMECVQGDGPRELRPYHSFYVANLVYTRPLEPILANIEGSYSFEHKYSRISNTRMYKFVSCCESGDSEYYMINGRAN